jgi:hypothetical protein
MFSELVISSYNYTIKLVIAITCVNDTNTLQLYGRVLQLQLL